MKKLLILFLLLYCFYSRAQDAFSVVVNDTLKFQTTIENHLQKDEKTGISSGSIYIKVNTGTINEGSCPYYDFYFVNNSSDPLILQTVYWGEPIFEPNYHKDPIMKGKPGKIRYICVENDRPGLFSKTATISTNFGQVIIRFDGVILPKTIQTSKLFDVSKITTGEKVNAQFKICNKADSALRITGIKTDAGITLVCDSSEAGITENAICKDSCRTFNVTFVPNAIGDVTSKVTIMIGWWKIEYNVFATVTAAQKKPSVPVKRASSKPKKSG
ncbi:MAG: hypothetical protein JWP12_3834 [Bacteroidetes bacterium]|nr:hypothetical protein [Bacteroidota bacterium]